MFLEKFRRITSSGTYFPEIDGLRFIAIITVLLFHIGSTVKVPSIHTEYDYLITKLYENGWQGVELFFVISGFIIGLPFANHYINGKKKISLKNYFIRRITRLEPPYILSLMIFMAILIATNQTTFHDILPSFLASVFYVNNVIFNDQNYLITVVIWTLEIEIQFYILAFLIAKLFELKKIARRSIFLSVILGFPIIHIFYFPTMPTIYLFLHFFMLGFLLVDFYLDEFELKINRVVSIILGIFTLFFILYFDYHQSLLVEYMYLLSICIFYYFSLRTDFWKSVMSNKYLALIGGMCYTIYLIHSPIISAFSRLSYLVNPSDYYIVNLMINTIILVPIVIIVSGGYFIMIEKPCMDKNWPQKLAFHLKNKFVKTTARK